MKNWRTPIAVFLTILLFWFIKFYLHFPGAPIDVVGVVLTIASILFGFLGGFFISELWSRYIDIRSFQSEWSSEGLNMLQNASHFFKDKIFEKDFKLKMEKALVADQIIDWHELNLELPYFREIGNSFEKIKLKDAKDEVYFDNLSDSYHDFVEAVVKLDTLGKEKLFLSEWGILIILSGIISLSVLFLDSSQIFYKIVILVFPAIITLSLNMIYDLDSLSWGRKTTTLEPGERLFDILGLKRFYSELEIKYKDPSVTDYRTEKDLTGELKEVLDNITKTRKKK